MRSLFIILCFFVLTCQAQIQPTRWTEGDFIGQVKATDPDSDPLVFEILSGNDNKTFRFGKKQSLIASIFHKDYTGNLHINNIKGLFNGDGSIRQKKFELLVQVIDPEGLRAKAYIMIIVTADGTQVVISNPRWDYADKTF
jgi:hypothetical protein